MINAVNEVASLSLTRGIGGVDLGKTTGVQSGMAVTPGSETGMSFTEVLRNMAQDTIETMKTAEVKSFEGIKGTASTREVVDAVMSAEQSLQTAIALRDKIVSAFLDITKMQI